MLEEKMPKKTNKRSEFIVRLEEDGDTYETYRLTKNLFLKIKNRIKPYRSLSILSKPVKCIETGQNFGSARQAANWLSENKITYSYSAAATIKMVCKGKKEKAYGYHWKFVEDSNNVL